MLWEETLSSWRARFNLAIYEHNAGTSYSKWFATVWWKGILCRQAQVVTIIIQHKRVSFNLTSIFSNLNLSCNNHYLSTLELNRRADLSRSDLVSLRQLVVSGSMPRSKKKQKLKITSLLVKPYFQEIHRREALLKNFLLHSNFILRFSQEKWFLIIFWLIGTCSIKIYTCVNFTSYTE